MQIQPESKNNTVLVERERKIAIVTINRPHAKNALDSATSHALAEAFKDFDRDDALDAAILTGAQGTFCAGADLREVAATDVNLADSVKFVYNATSAQGADAAATTPPDLAVTVQVFRDNEPVITTPLHPIATEGIKDLQRIPYGADLALKDLSTGAYVLQVTVIDRRAKSSAMQRFSFQIE